MNTELIDANIERAIAEFKEPDQIIANLAKEYLPMTLEYNGADTIIESRKRVTRLRIAIEKKRKELKEGSLKYGRAVDGEAKRLTLLLEPIESHLEKQEAIHSAERDRIKEEKRAAKAALLQTRLNRLAEIGVSGNVEQLQTIDEHEFELLYLQEKSASDKRRQAEADREAELALQAEELRKRSEEIEAERQRMRLHAEEIERQRLADQARIDEQREELRQQQEAERLRILAERQAEEAKELEAKRAAEEVARLARIEALRPEIDKAESFGNEIIIDSKKTLESLGNPHWSASAMESVRRCALEVLGIARGEA